MKILFIETSVSGHHLSYMMTLAEHFSKDEVHLIIPEMVSTIDNKKYHVHVIHFSENGKIHYLKWLRRLKKLIREEKPKVVHFLYGDSLYRYGGIGIGAFKHFSKVVITCHQFRHSRIRDLSYKMIGHNCDSVVVHTSFNKKSLNRLNIRNVVQIEYPQLTAKGSPEREVALKSLGIDPKGKLLLALGGTRRDKGLDLLLEALKKVKGEFHLLIAGKEEYFKREFIEQESCSYANRVTLKLGFLSDEEFSLCLSAADIVVLPYRKSFDGASGPLGEGVWALKEILGSDHGALGAIIKENHLGYVFDSENVGSLSKTLELALENAWNPDDKYLAYRRKMDPEEFLKEYEEVFYLK